MVLGKMLPMGLGCMNAVLMLGAWLTLRVAESLRVATSRATKVAIRHISIPEQVNALRNALLSAASFG